MKDSALGSQVDLLMRLLGRFRSGAEREHHGDLCGLLNGHLVGLDARMVDDDLVYPAFLAFCEGREGDACSLLQRVAEFDRQEVRWRCDPGFREPVVHVDDTTDGYVRRGDRFDPSLSVDQVAFLVGVGVREAMRVGYLPEGCRVTVSHSALSITVNFDGVCDGAVLVPDGPARGSRLVFRPSVYAHRVEQRLRAIAEEYSYSYYDRLVSKVEVRPYINVVVRTKSEVDGSGARVLADAPGLCVCGAEAGCFCAVGAAS